MAINWFLFYDEYHICKSLVVNQCSHISYKRRYCLVIDFILLKSADVQNANVVKPLASVEASENEQLLGANNASCVSLPTSWCLFEFQRMAPVHVLSV